MATHSGASFGEVVKEIGGRVVFGLNFTLLGAARSPGAMIMGLAGAAAVVSLCKALSDDSEENKVVSRKGFAIVAGLLAVEALVLAGGLKLEDDRAYRYACRDVQAKAVREVVEGNKDYAIKSGGVREIFASWGGERPIEVEATRKFSAFDSRHDRFDVVVAGDTPLGA